MRAKLNCKVVWWVDGPDGNPKRAVLGQRDAIRAWKLFTNLRGLPHVIAGPELWIGRKKVLDATKPSVIVG